MLIHNLSQILGWAYVFFLTVTNLKDSKGDLFLNHYREVKDFRMYLELFQTLQVLDVVFSILRLTNNSVMATLPQYISRIFVVHGIFPYVKEPEGQFSIIICVLMWSIIEVIRFSFYTIKQFPKLAESKLSVILGHVRYNTFIPVYPTGVTGELLAVYYAYQNIHGTTDKPFTVRMPNKWNFAFEYEYFLIIVPLVYLVEFPKLYMHMFR